MSGALTTGDVGLASCLHAVGVPPVPEVSRQLEVVKNADGSDFCRVALMPTTADGQAATDDLMRQWASGPAGVREHRATPMAALQVWNMCRGAMFALRRGEVMLRGLCGGHDVIVRERDAARWIDEGTGRMFLPREDAEPGFAAKDAMLAAALVALGADLLGVDGSGRWVYSRRSLEQVPDRMECAAMWPAPVRNTEADAGYMAAAATWRRAIMAAIKARDATLMFSRRKGRGKFEVGLLSEGGLKTGARGAEEVARKLRL